MARSSVIDTPQTKAKQAVLNQVSQGTTTPQSVCHQGTTGTQSDRWRKSACLTCDNSEGRGSLYLGKIFPVSESVVSTGAAPQPAVQNHTSDLSEETQRAGDLAVHHPT